VDVVVNQIKDMPSMVGLGIVEEVDVRFLEGDNVIV
jgi:hypothetical protein